MKKNIFSFFLLIIVAFSLQAQNSISLAGSWRCKLDPDSIVESRQWYLQAFDQIIQLPGTTDMARLGTKTSGPDYGILSREYKYIGPAWYNREIVIPASWSNQAVELMLERVMWESKVWIDGQPVGKAYSLSTPHTYVLGKLSPGKHQLTIRVNNDMIFNIGDKGHSYTEYTQSIWNGIVGKIEMKALPAVSIQQMDIHADAGSKKLMVQLAINNPANKKSAYASFDIIEIGSGKKVQHYKSNLSLQSSIPVIIPITFQPKLWDEFNPYLYKLVVTLNDGSERQSIIENFGFRTISTNRSKILINNNPVFLRGNLDCVHFPLTGYPSCDAKEWERIFRIYKSYGLNHVRFHSWCPPEAAFEAADKLGIYIMAEIIWIDWWMTKAPKDRPDMITKGFPEGLGKNPSADQYTQEEMKRIIQHYGNHPSFIMFCIGNELGNSDFNVMENWIKKIQSEDKRHLYSVSTARKIMPADQYNATHNIPEVGGTYGFAKSGTDDNLEKNYSAATIPIIAHEVGQFPVYPLWSEINKYTGVLKARNLDACYESAKKKGVDKDDLKFHNGSGALQQVLYKELIENILRTPSAAGFQLLSMQDYQGQGEALVGWLDAFYDSKGITTPQQFSMHSGAIVPLARLPKYVWTNNETFTAKILLANYSKNIIDKNLVWKITDAKGVLLKNGELPARIYSRGSLHEAGQIEVPLHTIAKAGKYLLEVSVKGSTIKNQWNIWVYPQLVETKNEAVLETTLLDSVSLDALLKGKSVLYYASGSIKKEKATPLFFKPLFWSNVFFPGQANTTLGSVINNRHPALALFPSDTYINWQWEKISKGNAIVLNDFPQTIRPIVQPISDFHINDKLATLFECNVGKGKLIVCGYILDTISNPVAKQLRYSLLNYMNSPAFSPGVSVPVETIRTHFPYIESAVKQYPAEGVYSNALLQIKAGKNATGADGHQDWSKAADDYVAKRNTNYTINKLSGIWKDNQTQGWYGKEIDISVATPQGVIGELYIHLYDWNQEGRESNIYLEGRSFASGPLEKNGKWIKLFVMREDTNDGILQLKLECTQGSNVMIDQLVFAEQL